jgi:hypothetical protein
MSRFTGVRLAVLVALGPGLCLAQGFPDASTEPPAAELRKLLSDKAFDIKTARGAAWRIQIRDNGSFDITVGAFEDAGEWTTEDGKWCTRPRKGQPACNEMRVAGGSLYMKRDNGEIVQFLPRP